MTLEVAVMPLVFEGNHFGPMKPRPPKRRGQKLPKAGAILVGFA